MKHLVRLTTTLLFISTEHFARQYIEIETQRPSCAIGFITGDIPTARAMGMISMGRNI
jgi:hypothetical protein